MKVTTEQLENRVTNLIIEVDEATARPALEKAARQASGRFQIPGFRKGRAPYDMVVRLVGEDYIYQEALEEMAPALVERALKEQEIEPYSTPRITDIQVKPMRLTVAVPLEPTVELGDYRSIHLERQAAPVTDEDVVKAVDELRHQRATREPIERPLQVGDFITGYLIATAPGEEPKQPEKEQTLRIPDAESESIPGLSEHLVGATVGDTVEFDSVFTPRDAEEGAEVTPVHVTVEINKTEQEVLPELNDEFAVLLGDYDNLDALKAEARGRLEKEAEEKATAQLQEQAMQALVDGATIVYPHAAVDDEAVRLAESIRQRLASQRVSLEAYLKATRMTPEQFVEQQHEPAEKSLRQGLALRKFIEAEGIAVTPEEMRARQDRTLANVGADSPDIAKYVRSEEFQRTMASNMLMGRAMRRLVSVVTGEPEPEEQAWPLEEMPAPAASVVEVSEGEEQPPAEAEEQA